MKQHTTFILQNILLKTILICYYYQNYYVLSKDFDRFLRNKAKHHGKKGFCQYCLKHFSRSIFLKCHTQKCLAVNHTKSILLPEENFH